MPAEIVTLADRRPPESRPEGYQWICEICQAEIVAAVRTDHFPSCHTCRWFCRAERQGIKRRRP